MAGDWEASDLAGVLEVFASSVDTLIPVPLQKLRSLYLPRAPRQERNTEQNTRATSRATTTSPTSCSPTSWTPP